MCINIAGFASNIAKMAESWKCSSTQTQQFNWQIQVTNVRASMYILGAGIMEAYDGWPKPLCIKIKSSANGAWGPDTRTTLSILCETSRCSEIYNFIYKTKTNSRHQRHRSCFSCSGSIPRLSAALSLTSAARRRGSGCGPAGARPAPAAISKQIKHIVICT